MLTREMNAFIGSPKSEAEWDLLVEKGEELVLELLFWVSMAEIAKPIWRAPSATLREGFLRGEGPVKVGILTDAAALHWGAILRILGEEEKKASGTYPEECFFAEQAHREGAGTLMGLEAFGEEIRGRVVIHLTDCTPVMAAMKSGSKRPIMQKVALAVWRLCARLGVDLISRADAIDRFGIAVRDDV